MAETQGDTYVRKDVFDARMDRLEMLLEKTTVEIKAYVDKSTSETKAEIAAVRDELRSLSIRVDNLEQKLGARVHAVENMLTWWIGLFAIILALAAFLTPIAGSIRKLFKPRHTLEEMEKIAERVAGTMIERHLSGGK